MSEKCNNVNCCPVRPNARSRDWKDYVGVDGYNAPLKYGAKGADISSSTAILLGVELELENDSVTNDSYSEAYHVFKDAKFGIFKSDCSLNDGVEINSVPATLDEHYKFDWPNALNMLKESGFESRSTCGIHIHLSYRPLSDDAIRNIAHFVYGPDNFNFVRFIAGRHSARWAEYKDVSLNNLDRHGFDRSYGLTVPGQTYRARDERKTLEFRLFASTLRVDRFMSRLEFVHALAVYANVPGRTTGEMNENDFINWLNGQSGYSYLRKKVEEFDRPGGRFRASVN